MKIALAFYGLPRCSILTFPTIRHQLIKPLAACGELRVFYHFMQQSHVRNPRSHEDHALGAENYAPFLEFEGRTEAPEAILPRLPLAELESFGDSWRDGFHSLRNLMLQLHSVHEVHVLAAAWQPDVFVFARPDMLYHDSVAPDVLQRCAIAPLALALPDWQWWFGGYNDRFAVCGREAAGFYAARKSAAMSYCEQLRQGLHSERLLRAVADAAKLKVEPIPLRASRVRASGAIVKEDFTRSEQTAPPGR